MAKDTTKVHKLADGTRYKWKKIKGAQGGSDTYTRVFLKGEEKPAKKRKGLFGKKKAAPANKPAAKKPTTKTSAAPTKSKRPVVRKTSSSTPEKAPARTGPAGGPRPVRKVGGKKTTRYVAGGGLRIKQQEPRTPALKGPAGRNLTNTTTKNRTDSNSGLALTPSQKNKTGAGRPAPRISSNKSNAKKTTNKNKDKISATTAANLAAKGFAPSAKFAAKSTGPAGSGSTSKQLASSRKRLTSGKTKRLPSPNKQIAPPNKQIAPPNKQLTSRLDTKGSKPKSSALVKASDKKSSTSDKNKVKKTSWLKKFGRLAKGGLKLGSVVGGVLITKDIISLLTSKEMKARLDKETSNREKRWANNAVKQDKRNAALDTYEKQVNKGERFPSYTLWLSAHTNDEKDTPARKLRFIKAKARWRSTKVK